MTRDKTVFLAFAFAGEEIKQLQKIRKIDEGYELWNLKKFSRDEFIDALKKKIPPVNNNVLRNYGRAKTDGNDPFGITEKQYKECSWGLFISDSLDGMGSYAETIFLLNLYTPVFLYPRFYCSDFGIQRISHSSFAASYTYQNQTPFFKTKKFVAFFKTLLPQSQYAAWQLNRIKKWSKEDWRLFVASRLFSGLEAYDNRKNIFGWQRESADMAAALEALFTAGDASNEEVGYRLRKRIATLLSWKIPSIEEEIKEIYSQRSAFVHGSFFAQIAKDSKISNNNLPNPDIKLLHNQRECVRLALVAYLHLARLIQENPEEYKDPTTSKNPTVMSVLERAIIDIKLRGKIVKEIKALFSLMPL